jgi:hypothetical protein
MRERVLGIVAAVVVLAGCGQKFTLPPQPEPGRIPTPGTYNLDKVWHLPSPTDVVLRGSYLFVIEEHARVNVYLSRQKEPVHPSFIGTFDGLTRPIQLCLAKRDSTFLFVADAADMTIKRYYFRGGPSLFSFTDTSWTSIDGIAADSYLNVYVSCAVRDSSVIYKYNAQGKRVRLISGAGTGQGFCIRPHGLAFVNNSVWVADPGNSRAQRLHSDSTNVAYPGRPIGAAFPLEEPVDVATDPAGQRIFVVEEQGDRILRFQPTGALEDTVYTQTRKETIVDPPIDAPRYVAADDSLVFLPDSANNRIVVVRLTKQ